jgi:hypothetical protein
MQRQALTITQVTGDDQPSPAQAWMGPIPAQQLCKPWRNPSKSVLVIRKLTPESSELHHTKSMRSVVNNVAAIRFSFQQARPLGTSELPRFACSLGAKSQHTGVAGACQMKHQATSCAESCGQPWTATQEQLAGSNSWCLFELQAGSNSCCHTRRRLMSSLELTAS